jgi:hypothetical protein
VSAFDAFPDARLVHRNRYQQKSRLSELVKVGLDQCPPTLSLTELLGATGCDVLDMHQEWPGRFGSSLVEPLPCAPPSFGTDRHSAVRQRVNTVARLNTRLGRLMARSVLHVDPVPYRVKPSDVAQALGQVSIVSFVTV